MAQVKGNVQEIEITVKGGYSPDIIRVQKGVPLRLIFNRQEAGDCSSRVVLPDFQVSKTLAPFAKTTLEFTPDKAGEFGFACGMNMLHGTLIVEEGERAVEPAEAPAPQRGNGHTHEHAQAVGVGPTMQVGEMEQVEFAIMGGGVTCPTCVVNIETVLKGLPGMDDVQVNFGAERITARYDPDQVSPEQMQQDIENTGYTVRRRSEPGTEETEDREAADRRAERRDLTRRLVIGAILTAPVLFAMMTHEFFEPSWLPSILLDPWFQLALITPVMLYTGWPIHRTGWPNSATPHRRYELARYCRNRRCVRI